MQLRCYVPVSDGRLRGSAGVTSAGRQHSTAVFACINFVSVLQAIVTLSSTKGRKDHNA